MKNFFYSCLSIAFFVILAIAVVMFTDTFFNGSSSFFDRFNDIEKIYEGLIR